MKKFEPKHLVRIIVAIIGFLGLVVVALIPYMLRQCEETVTPRDEGRVETDTTLPEPEPVPPELKPVSPEPEPVTPEPALLPLPMSGWYTWGGVTVTGGAARNECVINSSGRLADSAGIVNEHLGTALRGKTVILCFSNTGASRFSENRMAKIEGDNRVLLADNIISVMDFLPVEDKLFPNGFEFKIPNTFKGKLNFVFYQADLNNLKITAYYK
jgi:hypothetical protein